MEEANKRITRYYDTVPPYCSAFKISERKYESDTDKDHDVSYSKEHFELEISNPTDTVKVATFLRNKQYKPNENIKKEHYYVCEFKWESHGEIKDLSDLEEAKKRRERHPTIKTDHLLFRIYWEDDFNCWQRGDVFACSDASSNQEAADWMLKEITTKGSEVPEQDSDYFKKGTLEILI